MKAKEYFSDEALRVYDLLKRAAITEAVEPAVYDLQTDEKNANANARRFNERREELAELGAKIAAVCGDDLALVASVENEVRGWLRNENGTTKSPRIMGFLTDAFKCAVLSAKDRAKAEGETSDVTDATDASEGAPVAVKQNALSVLFDGYDELLAISDDVRDDELPPDADLIGDPPAPSLVATVAAYGVVTPIWLRAKKEGDAFYTVIAGRRRIKAARRAGRFPIRALIFPAGAKITDILTLLENQRSDNAASDFMAIESLAKQGVGRDEIAALIGIAKPTLDKRLRLLSLNNNLRAALVAGRMRISVAEAAAKCSKAEQKQLADDLAKRLKDDPKARIYLDHVAALRRKSVSNAVATLPASLFETPNQIAPDWKEEVKRHVARAIEAAPPSSPVAAALRESLRLATIEG